MHLSCPLKRVINVPFLKFYSIIFYNSTIRPFVNIALRLACYDNFDESIDS